jgi:hypothetical protein
LISHSNYDQIILPYVLIFIFLSSRPRTNSTSSGSVVITHQICALSQPLNNEIMALSPAVNILHIISGSLKMAGCIVALGDEDVVISTALQGLVEWDWWALKGGWMC